jgi:hypothetical protein
MGVRLYPLSLFRWEEKRCRAYGESEIPYLIPNQIAINRTVSAGVWAVMMMGMPIMLVNGDVVQQPITNDHGQVIPVYGSGEEVQNAVRYVDPPAFTAQLDTNVQNLINDTMTQAGISTTLLGDVKPDNTSAILAVREAATLNLNFAVAQLSRFVEDVALVWYDLLRAYHPAGLMVEGQLIPGKLLAALEPCVRVDLSPANPYSKFAQEQSLQNLLTGGFITFAEYVEALDDDAAAPKEKLRKILTSRLYDLPVPETEQIADEER